MFSQWIVICVFVAVGVFPSEGKYVKNEDDNYPKCPENQYFDKFEDTCMDFPGGGKPIFVDYSGRCSDGYTGLKKHPTQNRYYYFCTPDSVIIGKCHDSQIFERKKNECICRPRSTPRTIKIYDASDSRYEVPTCMRAGRFPVSSALSYFYSCEYAMDKFLQKIMRCPGDTRFDSMQSRCDYNHDEYYPPCQMAGRFRSPKTCSKYFVCKEIDAKKFAQLRYKCPARMIFSTESEKCVPEHLWQCEPKTLWDILSDYRIKHKEDNPCRSMENYSDESEYIMSCEKDYEDDNDAERDDYGKSSMTQDEDMETLGTRDQTDTVYTTQTPYTLSIEQILQIIFGNNSYTTTPNVEQTTLSSEDYTDVTVRSSDASDDGSGNDGSGNDSIETTENPPVKYTDSLSTSEFDIILSSTNSQSISDEFAEVKMDIESRIELDATTTTSSTSEIYTTQFSSSEASSTSKHQYKDTTSQTNTPSRAIKEDSYGTATTTQSPSTGSSEISPAKEKAPVKEAIKEDSYGIATTTQSPSTDSSKISPAKEKAPAKEAIKEDSYGMATTTQSPSTDSSKISPAKEKPQAKEAIREDSYGMATTTHSPSTDSSEINPAKEKAPAKEAIREDSYGIATTTQSPSTDSYKISPAKEKAQAKEAIREDSYGMAITTHSPSKDSSVSAAKEEAPVKEAINEDSYGLTTTTQSQRSPEIRFLQNESENLIKEDSYNITSTTESISEDSNNSSLSYITSTLIYDSSTNATMEDSNGMTSFTEPSSIVTSSEEEILNETTTTSPSTEFFENDSSSVAYGSTTDTDLVSTNGPNVGHAGEQYAAQQHDMEIASQTSTTEIIENKTDDLELHPEYDGQSLYSTTESSTSDELSATLAYTPRTKSKFFHVIRHPKNSTLEVFIKRPYRVLINYDSKHLCDEHHPEEHHDLETEHVSGRK